MQKLLTASLLLASWVVQPACAQRTIYTPSKVLAPEAVNPPTQVPDWVAAEFSEAYGRYFPDLPAFYRYTVGQALRTTSLATSSADLASTLVQNTGLRETVYQSVYQYCHALQYGFGNKQGVNELVYQMLYNEFHLSDLAATRLAPYISSRYKQPAPAPQYCAYPAGSKAPDKRTSVTSDAPSSSSNHTGSGGGSGLEMNGWRFDNTPVVEAVDDEEGVIRFKVKISDDGEVESVTKMSGNVSSAQERLCRNKLLDAHFAKTNGNASATTGYYTFRFSVK